MGGGINTYIYTFDNPIISSDPAGTDTYAETPEGPVFMPSPNSPGSASLAQAAQAALNAASANFQNNAQYFGGLAADWLWNEMHSEPVLPDVNPGRDCKGNCKPCPPGIKWYVPGPGHGHPNGFWHEIKYNQDPATCMCYADRPSRGLKGH